MSEPKYEKWYRRDDSTYSPVKGGSIVESIDCGVYRPKYSSDIGYHFSRIPFDIEELFVMPSSIHERVIDSIKTFISAKKNYERYKFTFKRGVLLHGKPGSGKTCLIDLICKYCITQLNAVVITIADGNELALFSQELSVNLRMVESDRLLIVVFEDIDGLARGETETALLNLLDGINQINSVIYLATTNYIENLKERLINRPSRFDERIYIPFLNATDRRYYFEHKLLPEHLSTINIDLWVKETEEMSFAHLSELIKSTFILGEKFETVIARLKQMNDFKGENSTKYERENSRIGFGKNSQPVYEKTIPI